MDARREGRVALHELEVLGDEEDEPEEAEEGDGDGDRATGEARDPEDPDVEKRPLGAQLDQREQGQEEAAAAKQAMCPATPSPTAGPR